MESRRGNIIKDAVVVAVSVALAVILAKAGAFEAVLTATQEARYIGNFVAGMFFVSVFTAAPATVALAEIAQSHSLILTALIGGLGALAGDWLIFRFMRDRIAEDVAYLMKAKKMERISLLFRRHYFRWLIPVTGALIVASPLPDEAGLALLGMSDMKTSRFIVLSFLLNSAGILVIGLIARA